MVKAEDFIRMPLAELTTPVNGRICLTNRYWAVTENNEALFYRTHNSPQCSTNIAIVEQLASPLRKKILLIPVAFVPHRSE